MAGVLELIPLIGPLTIAVAATIVGGFESGWQAFLTAAFLMLLRIAQDYFIYPRIIREGIHLHPLAVILAILAGAEIAGVAGIFLAIPAIAIITVSYRHWLEHRGSETIAEVIEEAVVSPPEPEPIGDLARPTLSTTPEEMARVRPDLLTGELKPPE
jgi:predicted PurR-regulated permease PerM